MIDESNVYSWAEPCSYCHSDKEQTRVRYLGAEVFMCLSCEIKATEDALNKLKQLMKETKE